MTDGTDASAAACNTMTMCNIFRSKYLKFVYSAKRQTLYQGNVTSTSKSSGKKELQHTISFQGVTLMPLGGKLSWGHMKIDSYNTSLTILTHFLKDRKRAEKLAHRFKREVIADLYINLSWELSLDAIQAWYKEDCRTKRMRRCISA